MLSRFAFKDVVLILRMFTKCLSVNLFLSAVIMFFMHEKNCSQQYVLPHMHNNFLDKFTISLNSLTNVISYKIKEVCALCGRFSNHLDFAAQSVQVGIRMALYHTEMKMDH